MRTLLSSMVVGFVALGVGCTDDDPDPPPEDVPELVAFGIRRSVCIGADLIVADEGTDPSYRDDPIIQALGLDCTLASTSCAEVIACIYGDVDRPCDPQTFTSTCTDGSTIELCFRYFNEVTAVATVPCDQFDPTKPLNSMCIVSNNRAQCAAGTCMTSGDQCQGDVSESCSPDLLLRREDCAATGQSCFQLPAGRTICGVASSTCAVTVADPYCDGNDIVSCTGDLEVMRQDCTGSYGGAVCRQVDRFASCGLPEELSECEDDLEECRGDIARICRGNKLFEIDCSTFLDATCVIDDTGDARCKAPSWP